MCGESVNEKNKINIIRLINFYCKWNLINRFNKIKSEWNKIVCKDIKLTIQKNSDHEIKIILQDQRYKLSLMLSKFEIRNPRTEGENFGVREYSFTLE